MKLDHLVHPDTGEPLEYIEHGHGICPPRDMALMDAPILLMTKARELSKRVKDSQYCPDDVRLTLDRDLILFLDAVASGPSDDPDPFAEEAPARR